MDGKIFGFLGLVASHRGAVEYDWRTRFGVGTNVIGFDMPLGEAARLAEILCSDPSSMTHSSVAGWAFPITRETLALLDLYDATTQIATDPKKRSQWKAHAGRPFKPDRESRRRGSTGGRTREEIDAILRDHGHAPPV